MLVGLSGGGSDVEFGEYAPDPFFKRGQIPARRLNVAGGVPTRPDLFDFAPSIFGEESGDFSRVHAESVSTQDGFRSVSDSRK